MDANVQRLLSDKLYDKRKAGALELENVIRTCLSESNHDRIKKITHQLCEYAYAVHQPHVRNGGLIGLAAAAIALGLQVARYLRDIVPPVLACFTDQDARVRYYACESMYNIAKVSKGEILVYFNDVFDALCKLAADTELSVKNGAELLDRLVKDIVSESAATYSSIVVPEPAVGDSEGNTPDQSMEMPIAFSLPRFIPLLQERINVLNPFTRTFLVSWIVLLDSIPDLELVVFLPSFLGGLLKFLGDPNQDVHTTTRSALERFLLEIRKIAAVKKGIAESKKSREGVRKGSHDSSAFIADGADGDAPNGDDGMNGDQPKIPVVPIPDVDDVDADATDGDSAITDEDDEEFADDDEPFDDEWIPGQDVHIDYQQILDILVTFLSESSEEEVQITTLRWIESFMDICPEDILVFTPRLLAQVLPSLSHHVDHVKQSANRVNQGLMAYILSLPEEPTKPGSVAEQPQAGLTPSTSASILPVRASKEPSNGGELNSDHGGLTAKMTEPKSPDLTVTDDADSIAPPHIDLDYEAAVSSLTLQFLHEHEATRVAALAWLIMLHRKSPRKIQAVSDAAFPALLKTLSDPAESVVTRDLLLLSQISKSSDDSYFSSFMVNLLKLFCTDRRLLETRGNLIIRQLCLTLPAEKIYRTMADCLERDEDDIEFASIMVQNLNNNLITAPELQDLRKRLRNLDSRDGQTFFTVLFRAWCVNAVATFSLCLLAQAYEQAYNLLQIFADMEMTVNMLIQIDKLVQLIESPSFTFLRMQLLEPERFPHLYKCLYGLLMLLPQSSAFAALKNRLNSVSAIGYLHIAPRGPTAGSGPGGASAATPSSVSSFERQNRLKARDDAGIRWTELLEKFRSTQDRLRRAQNRQLGIDPDVDAVHDSAAPPAERRSIGPPGAGANAARVGQSAAGAANGVERPASAASVGRSSQAQQQQQARQDALAVAPGQTRPRSGLGHLRGLAKVGKKDKDRK